MSGKGLMSPPDGTRDNGTQNREKTMNTLIQQIVKLLLDYAWILRAGAPPISPSSPRNASASNSPHPSPTAPSSSSGRTTTSTQFPSATRTSRNSGLPVPRKSSLQSRSLWRMERCGCRTERDRPLCRQSETSEKYRTGFARGLSCLISLLL